MDTPEIVGKSVNAGFQARYIHLNGTLVIVTIYVPERDLLWVLENLGLILEA